MALTESGQLALRNKARAELERLESLENDKETIEKVEAFKRKFSRCEIVYKILLKKKARGRQEKTERTPKDHLHPSRTCVVICRSSFRRKFDEEVIFIESNFRKQDGEEPQGCLDSRNAKKRSG